MDSDALSPPVERLLAGQMTVWREQTSHSDALKQLRSNNPEWDFMSRTFMVLTLANVSLRDPGRQRESLELMDQLIERTLREEAEEGPQFFLLPYWQRAPFVGQPAQTLFVEGEIAMMLAARQLIEADAEVEQLLRERIEGVIAQMEAGPVLSGESYPDECWMFCNTLALAALRVADVALGTDHSALLDRWSTMARARLVDPATGMLVSEFTYDGTHLDGPEGSSIFAAAHFLSVVDPGLALGQYELARRHLVIELAGFAWAREWPEGARNDVVDIDSGPSIPIVEANAGASGMAILGAAAFDDRELLVKLLTSLELAGFPIDDGESLRFGASNRVGDAVLLYALVQGPLWDEVGAALERGTVRQRRSER